MNVTSTTNNMTNNITKVTASTKQKLMISAIVMSVQYDIMRKKDKAM